jgi:bifunctional UDP-N-acetylglucosamine pyrophosphorylase/glucosamine-1-phosphate N-acetyltransferase
MEKGVSIGPFAHLRGGNYLKEGSAIGNFVEVKKSTIGEKSKAKHLAYIGDATLGTKVNIGAGTITANYDGKSKFKTTIGDNVMVGSNSTLIAPITLENSVYVAAGSVITKDVPENTLVFGRARQVHKQKKTTEG